jgi:hypothetical protein
MLRGHTLLGGILFLFCLAQVASAQQPINGLTEYERLACEFSASAGEGIDLKASQAHDIRETHFHKKIDYAELLAVAHASVKDTIEYVQSKGIRIYVGDEDSLAPCGGVFSSLPPLPADLIEEWHADREDGELRAGMFLPPTGASEDPVIILRRDANRWTLLHEFGHFLFDSGLRGNPNYVTPQEISDELERRMQWLAAAVADPKLSAENFTKVTDLFHDTAPLVYVLAIRSSLEEVTIELMLGDAYQRQEITYTPASARASFSYIVSSIKVALSSIKDWQDLVASGERAATVRELEAEKARLHALADEAEKNTGVLQKLLAQFTSR